MLVYEHRRKVFPILSVRHIPQFGYGVIGTKTPGARKSFAVIAHEAPGFGFRTEQEASEALGTIKANAKQARVK